MMSMPTRAELTRIAESVAPRHGWDFSRMRAERAPVPWEYLEVVRRYLTPRSHVLDVGTGGGEKLAQLADAYGSAVGVDPDPDMLEAARSNTAHLPHLSFEAIGAEHLDFPAGTFDVVLTRHAPVVPDQIARVLTPGGVFVCQGVGARNMDVIRRTFDTGSGTRYAEDRRNAISRFETLGCTIEATAEYDVPYVVKDVESLLFWFQAIAGANEVPADYTIERYGEAVQRIIEITATPEGYHTNEHRTLLVVCKPA